MNINSTSNMPSSKRRSMLVWLGLLSIAGVLPSAAQERAGRQLDVPYQPSPQPVVDKMLELANVDRQDLVVDLGSGDGQIVITAAKKYGARGIGIDLDPQRVDEARANARRAAVEDRVQFRVGDLYTANFSDATVVTLFLWPEVNRTLRPLLWRQLKVGTRVVSYIWDMGPEWPPEKIATVEGKKIYHWTITEAQKKAAERPAGTTSS